MGEGNLTYRQELWGGGPPTYLGRASVLQLASHPLFTRSNRGRWDAVESAFKSLEFSATTNGTLRIQGVVTGAIPPYAVIAYVWPVSEEMDDHLARTFPCVLKDGGFTLDLDGLRPGNRQLWHLKLARLHVNGAAAAQEFHLRYNASSAPDVAALNTEWTVTRAESAVEAAIGARDWSAATARLDAVTKLAPASFSDMLNTTRLQILLGAKDERAALKLIRQMGDAHKADSINESTLVWMIVSDKEMGAAYLKRFMYENYLAWMIVSDKAIAHPDLDLAEELAQRSIDDCKEDSSKADVYDTMARIKFMKGQKEEAVALEQKVVALL
jgi:hypothetical protein